MCFVFFFLTFLFYFEKNQQDKKEQKKLRHVHNVLDLCNLYSMCKGKKEMLLIYATYIPYAQKKRGGKKNQI
jgi:hypothetical protein